MRVPGQKLFVPAIHLKIAGMARSYNLIFYQSSGGTGLGLRFSPTAT